MSTLRSAATWCAAGIASATLLACGSDASSSAQTDVWTGAATVWPVHARVGSSLSCVVTGKPATPRVAAVARWSINGADAGLARVLTTGFHRGDAVRCATVVSGPPATTLESGPRIIANTAPRIEEVFLEPAEPRPGDRVMCGWLGFEDADGDADESRVAWTVDGLPAGTGVSLGQLTRAGSRIACVVTPFDGTDVGAPVSAAGDMLNRAPTVADAQILAVDGDAAAWTCQWTGFNDPDGDADRSFVRWSVNERDAGSAAALDASRVAIGDQLACVVTPFDGYAAGPSVTTRLTVGRTRPSVAGVSVTPENPRAADGLWCDWRDFVGEADASVAEWTLNGVFTSVGRTLAGGYVYGDRVACTVTPFDGYSDGARVSAEVVIQNTPPTIDEAFIDVLPTPLGTQLVCTWQGYADDDGQSDHTRLHWTLDDVVVWHSPVMAAPNGSERGVACVVTPHDGVDDGEPLVVALDTGHDPECGDGVAEGEETCDDGVNVGGYGGCRPGCGGMERFCGDGVVDPEEGCDDGVNSGGYGGCLADCSGLDRYCGDGVRDPEEGCDHGDNSGGYDSCAPGCAGLARFCGDGVVDPEERCDDGSNVGGYEGCEAGCAGLDRYCGDGVDDPEEGCDDGLNVGGYDGCAPGCAGLDRYCGDGVADLEEACDDGVNSGAPGACEPGCTGLAQGFNHQGWSDVVAIGPKMDAAGGYVLADGSANPDVANSDRVLTFSWNAFAGPAADGYAIYRASASGTHDLGAAPLAIVDDPAVRTFADTQVTTGAVYYYVVRPMVGGVAYPTPEPYSELRVVAPPANMALVHRWIANQEVCGQLPPANASTVDPLNHNRCAFAGQGHSDGFYDLGHDLLVDRFELGCAYGAEGVTYDATSAACALNGTPAASAGPEELERLAANSAHLPPLVQIDQAQAQRACEGQLADLDLAAHDKHLPKRLLRLKEARAVAAWPPTWDGTGLIASVENGATVVGSGDCNTNGAHGGSYPPSHADVAGLHPGVFRTGSHDGTHRCVSRYGAQDAVGNVMEWTSDQCDWISTTCVATGAIDPDNADLSGFNNVHGHNTLFTDAAFFSPALGLPLAVAEDGAWAVSAFGFEAFHADYWDGHNPNGVGVLVGGDWTDRGGRGRWTADLDIVGARTEPTVGVRCATALAYCDTNAECLERSICYQGICVPRPFLGSCRDILLSGWSDGDGVYTIDPDGMEFGAPEFDVYCDMTWLGGGWTLAFHHDLASGFDPSAPGVATATCFDETCSNRAFSTVRIVGDVLFDASDAAMSGPGYGLRTTIVGVDQTLAGGTLAQAFEGADVHIDALDNSNVSNDWQNGMSCGSTGGDNWGDWRRAVCNANRLVTFNDDLACGDPRVALIGVDDQDGDSGTDNCAGWDAEPHLEGTNWWPDSFRVWVR